MLFWPAASSGREATPLTHSASAAGAPVAMALWVHGSGRHDARNVVQVEQTAHMLCTSGHKSSSLAVSSKVKGVRTSMQAEHKIQSADGPLVLQLQKVSPGGVNTWLGHTASSRSRGPPFHVHVGSTALRHTSCGHAVRRGLGACSAMRYTACAGPAPSRTLLSWQRCAVGSCAARRFPR